MIIHTIQMALRSVRGGRSVAYKLVAQVPSASDVSSK